MDEITLSVELERVKDFEFRVNFGDEVLPLLVDEPSPLGSGRGPNASRLLSAAIGNCLSASLLFCLHKAHLEPRSIRATVTTRLARTATRRMRIAASRVTITLDIDAGVRERLGRCTDLFEDYCVVTQSVRGGIPVEVEVRDQSGAVLYESHDAPV